MNESVIFRRITDLLDWTRRCRAALWLICMALLLIYLHLMSCFNLFSDSIIGVWSVQLCACNLLICQAPVYGTEQFISVCVCVRVCCCHQEQMKLKSNLICAGKVSYPFWLSWKWDASHSQWIVESDALMVWVENRLTYIQAGAEREGELKLFDFMPCVCPCFLYSCRIFWGGCAVNEGFLSILWHVWCVGVWSSGCVCVYIPCHCHK